MKKNLPLEEQESIVLYDYYDNNINIYTSRLITYKRIMKILGQPSKIMKDNDLFYNAEWIIPFTERDRIAKATSIMTLLKKVHEK